jgi:signal transduction histidine kinase/DNA-binding response OmpR family regulator
MKLIERKIRAGFGAALGLLLLIGVVGSWSAFQALNTFREVDHSRDILDRLEKILDGVFETESGNRGYAISGDERFLDRYHDGVHLARHEIEAVKFLTRENPDKQSRLTELETLVQKKIAFGNEVIERGRTGDRSGTLEFIAASQGKRIMDQIHDAIGALAEEETNLLHERLGSAQSAAQRTIVIVIISSLVAVVFVAIASCVVHRDLMKRKRAEQARDRLNQELERRVEERTVELREAVSTTQRYADELEAANATIKRERLDLARRVEARTSELRAANTQLEKVSRHKSEFLSHMSHELRTPLNGVLGMNELLLTTGLTPRQRQFVEAAASSGKHLLQMVNDVLDLAKIEAGKLELDYRECQLEAFVYDVLSVFSPSARQKGLTLTCEMDPRICVRGRCDDHRLRQILVNLLNNAFKFTESGGVKLRVHSRRADEIKMPGPPVVVRFSVSDAGVGIPREKCDRLFAPFSQIDPSTARRFGGSGLGLAICKQLVELMGGTIGVESEPGVGTTVWFEVPIELTSDGLGIERVRQILDGTRVLAVDGIDHDRRQIGDCLSAWGCRAEQVATLRDAVDAVALADGAGTPFDVVLVDCRLTEGDEFVLLQKLAKNPRLPIIGLGHDENADSVNFLRQLGVRHVLLDPVRPSALFNALSSVLSITPRRLNADVPPGAASNILFSRLAGHVLVAEDNHVDQLFVVELLKSFGCTCDAASDGNEALQLLAHSRYDLILMDCLMPEMDGYDATREIRRREASGELSGRLPIIALTANALQGARELCLETGMDDYLPKPLHAVELHAVLKRYLRSPSAEGTE